MLNGKGQPIQLYCGGQILRKHRNLSQLETPLSFGDLPTGHSKDQLTCPKVWRSRGFTRDLVLANCSIGIHSSDIEFNVAVILERSRVPTSVWASLKQPDKNCPDVKSSFIYRPRYVKAGSGSIQRRRPYRGWITAPWTRSKRAVKGPGAVANSISGRTTP